MAYQMKIPTTISLPQQHKLALILKAQSEDRSMNAVVAEWIEEHASEFLEQAKKEVQGG